MNNVEKLLENIQVFIDNAGEEFLIACVNVQESHGEAIETIEDLNNLLETEISNWEE